MQQSISLWGQGPTNLVHWFFLFFFSHEAIIMGFSCSSFQVEDGANGIGLSYSSFQWYYWLMLLFSHGVVVMGSSCFFSHLGLLFFFYCYHFFSYFYYFSSIIFPFLFIMRKYRVLQLGLQLGFLVAMDIYNSWYLYNLEF